MKRGASQIIKDYLTQHDITKTRLAYLLHESVQNLSKKLKKTDLDSNYLAKISDALNHNFFEDLAREYEQAKLQKELGISVLERKSLSREDFIRLYTKMQEQIDYLILNAKKNEQDKVQFKKSIDEIKDEKEALIQSLYKQQEDLIQPEQVNEDEVKTYSEEEKAKGKKAKEEEKAAKKNQRKGDDHSAEEA
ncbi:MAG: hypothetical protein JNL13_03740 [Chitinophagaceae bacterium]|nr:hypothetical protein [Chitinophagaceae bacterium]